VLFIIFDIVNVGQCGSERFVIIVDEPCTRDFLPSAWGNYSRTFWDWSTYIRHDRPVPVAAVPVPAASCR